MIKVPKRFASANFFLMLFLSIIAALAVMKIAAKVLIPLVLAVLISMVLAPLIKLLNDKLKIPNIISVVIVLLVLMLAVAVIGTILITSLGKIIEQYPKYEQRFTVIYETIAKMFELPFNEELSLFTNLWMQAGVRSFVQDLALTLSTKLFSLIKDFMMIVLFCLFFLSEFRYLNEKIELAFADVLPNKIRDIIQNIVDQVTRYISVKFYISLLTGIIFYVGALCVRLDFPVIWAFIAFVMNFIPAIGSIISCVLTMMFALLQFWPSLTPFVITAVFSVGTNLVLGNIVEPKIQGDNLGLSPFVIIAALSIWGWIWGFAGMVIAIPLMVIIKIICENVSVLNPVSILLGTLPAAKAAAEEVEEEATAEVAEENHADGDSE